MTEINIKIETASPLDKNISKINDLIRGFVMDLKKLCEVKKYDLVGLKFKNEKDGN